MDKQKMIEEMAQCKALFGFACNGKLLGMTCNSCKFVDKCVQYCRAEEMYEEGIRKIPENAVVLTKEEYKKWLEFVISYLILFVCEHRRGLGEDALWQPNEDEREKIPLDLDNMFKKIVGGE